jgi:hypothetical protein
MNEVEIAYVLDSQHPEQKWTWPARGLSGQGKWLLVVAAQCRAPGPLVYRELEGHVLSKQPRQEGKEPPYQGDMWHL